jgi:HemY protein
MRAVLYILQISGLMALAAWGLAQPGTFDIALGVYRAQGQTGFLFLLALAAVLVILTVHRLWLWIAHFPRTWVRYRRDVHLIRGHQALSRALSALAAGDTETASIQASRARALLPDFVTVPQIVLATAAEAQGHGVAARVAMTELLSTEARDIGVRGLVKAALQENRLDDGLRIARGALAHAPSQITLERLVYDLECQAGLWDEAIKRLPRLISRRVRRGRPCGRPGLLLPLIRALFRPPV